MSEEGPRGASAVTLLRPASPEQWAAARRLVEQYAASLQLDLDFQNFDDEIASLPRAYGSPDGCFVLAAQDEGFVGCGGIRRHDASACEMKRLYVVPAARGGGIARQIAERLIAHARERGYRSVLLDTLPTMAGAQALYRSLGFTPTDPYRFNPVPGATFWKLRL
jgi:ribosomal protein S18 acetylase RimI-like enzyme